MSNNYRSKPTQDVKGFAHAIDTAYNEQAGALKVLSHIVGHLIPLGNCSSAAIDCTKNGALIAVYNDSATTGFVATGAADVTAPTTGANGIACRPYDYTIVALANTDTQIIGISGGTLWAYLVDDTANFN